MDTANILLIEYHYSGNISGEIKVIFNEFLTLFEIRDILKRAGYAPEGITESNRIARVFYHGKINGIRLLVESMVGSNKVESVTLPIDNIPIEDSEIDFDIRLAELATECLNEDSEYFEHDQETSSVGGTASEGTEEKTKQSSQVTEGGQLHSVDSKDACGHFTIPLYQQEQARTGRDSGDLQTHYAGDEMTAIQIKHLYSLSQSHDYHMSRVAIILLLTTIVTVTNSIILIVRMLG